VAYRRAGTGDEQRGDEAAAQLKRLVTDGIDAAVVDAESAELDAVVDVRLLEPEGDQLPPPDDAALPRREPRDPIFPRAIVRLTVTIAVDCTIVRAHGRIVPRRGCRAGACYEVGTAQGTSTESSVGESRATTYSAGSVSERLTTMCVWRGGT
jgi:hypothetical protein